MSKVFVPKQENLFSVLFTCGCSIFNISYYLKHTLMLDYYKDYVVLHGKDGPVNPSPRLINMVSAVNEDLKSFVSEYTAIKPLIVPGLRTLNAGTVGTFAGGVVGLPSYFEFNDVADANDKIKKTGPSIDEKAVEEYCNCFVLSDEAKKYAIAREILCVNTYQVYCELLIPIGISFTIHAIFKNAPLSFLHKVHPIGQGLFYALVLVSAFSMWRTLHSLSKNYTDREIEDNLSSLGVEYVEGAIEFYSKALERRALQLEWKEQNKRFVKTISDILHSIVSRREISMSYKLAFYKSKLNALKGNNNKE